ncbi:MFS transporter [Carnimonas nigrificans]|uniref:MFS transporter n=1 Tax=Carnimonas nigrificans TaxID=64323 RepID=UPI00046EF1DE|nr:MFS transporter [Carnimonas nigrificans]
MNTPHSPESILDQTVRKIKWRILPLFVIMFIANYVDRVNVGFVRPYLQEDIGISTAAFGFGAGLFFIGYAIFEVPSNMLMQKFGARAWLTRIMVTWGIVSAATAFVQNETQFYILRILLGFAEAGFFPGVLYYFTRWLPASQRGKAVAVFLGGSALATIISGPLSGALLNISGLGLHGWQWLMVLEGGASVVLGAFVLIWLDSRPEQAKWLSNEERTVLLDALANEQEEKERAVGGHLPALALLKDPQILIFSIMYFCISLTIYGATFWLPSIIRSMGGMSNMQVGMLNSIPWMISIVAMYTFASLASKWKFQQGWAAFTLVIASLGMFASTQGGPVFAFVAICFAAIGFKASSSLFWPIPQGYLDARIAAGVLALINSIGGLGGFVAPTVFGILEEKTGSVEGGLYVLACTSLFAACLILFTKSRPHRKAQNQHKPEFPPELHNGPGIDRPA